MRDLYPRSRLHKMNLVNSPNCLKCNNPYENIIHMFWQCPTVYEIWNQLLLWLNSKLNINLQPEASQILLSHELDCDVIYWDIITLAYTFCKQAIYANKDEAMQIKISYVKKLIVDCETTEKEIATKNKTLQKHLDKWHNLSSCQKPS